MLQNKLMSIWKKLIAETIGTYNPVTDISVASDYNVPF